MLRIFGEFFLGSTNFDEPKRIKVYCIGDSETFTNDEEPKKLSEFSKVCPYYDDCENCKHKSENCKEWREVKRPPESWGYIR